MLYKFLKLKKALKKSWGIDTAYRADVANWSIDNPAAGQCAISALIIHDYFGGSIYSGMSEDGVIHFWNKIYGFKIDITDSQFIKPKNFMNLTKWRAEDLLLTGNVKERYTILKSRVEDNMK